MGNLKPGVKYIYSNKDGVVYQREEGSLEEEAIGWNYDSRTDDGKPLIDQLRDNKLWGDIHRAAKTNPVLREALERVKILYELSKTDEQRS